VRDEQKVLGPVILAPALHIHPVRVEIAVDRLLGVRLPVAPLSLCPAHQAVVDGLVVVRPRFDPDVAVGDEHGRLLRVEGDPAEVGKPDLDPRMAALSHLKGDDSALALQVEGLVEGDAVHDPRRDPFGPHQGGCKVGKILAVASSRLERVQGVALCGRRHVTDVVDHVSEYPLYGVEFGRHSPGQFFRPFHDAGVGRPGLVPSLSGST